MKPPAFQFYPADFIEGTCDLPAADVGAYIRLLCYQWSRGDIPLTEAAKLERIAGCAVSPDVLAKFPDGRNARMEEVRRKQDEYRQQQADKGRASAKARFNRGSTAVQPTHQPEGQPEGNSPTPSPSLLNTIQGAAKPPRSVFVKPLPHEVEAYATQIGYPMNGQAWCDSYEQKGWMVGKVKMKDWKAAVRNWKSNGWTPTSKPGGSTPKPDRINFQTDNYANLQT